MLRFLRRQLKWWNAKSESCMPHPWLELDCKRAYALLVPSSAGTPHRALFREQYRTHEYAPLREAFEFKGVLHSVRDITPYNCLEFR